MAETGIIRAPVTDRSTRALTCPALANLVNRIADRYGARIKIVQNKVRDSVGYALYYIRQGGTHNVQTNQAA